MRIFPGAPDFPWVKRLLVVYHFVKSGCCKGDEVAESQICV
jgi:hypothetical protein